MKTLILDCDGVLLNWRDPFNAWLIQHGILGHSQWDAASYSPSGLVPDFTRHVKMFNQTHYISKLPPVPGAVKAVRQFHESGFLLKIVTAFSSEYEAIKMREANLSSVFGPVFAELVALPVGSSKTDWLKQQDAENCIYVEDIWRHAKEALDVGFQSEDVWLIQQPYNQRIQGHGYSSTIGASRAQWPDITDHYGVSN